MLLPTLLFGHLLTSSNYNDEEKKVTGGRNGYGAKLCNIFSTKFSVETASSESQKIFKQTWTNNMNDTKEATILPFKGTDYTKITFKPDLSKFKMDSLDKDIVALMSRRAFDVAGSSRGVKVFLNGKKLPIKNFKDYIDVFIKDQFDENDQPLKLVYELVNDRWEIGVTQSSKGFQQISFVNSIATTKGGTHLNYVMKKIIKEMKERIQNMSKSAFSITPSDVKKCLWIFVNCLIENPTFDSQTKENMTLQAKSFGSKCKPTEIFFSSVTKCGIVEKILQLVRFKAQTQLNKKCHSTKHSKLTGIPKLEDANDAGTKNSINCTLILTEGDSAKTLAVSGLGVVGRDRYGVFPLKGKILNVREANDLQIMGNAEINNIIKIMGLQYGKEYRDIEDLKSLRYGRLMIMTDQDQDGSHIKGLLINFIHHNWPSLLKLPFLEEFITPLVKVIRGNEKKEFYSLPEYEEWKSSCDAHFKWKVKYYKGLGTSTAKEAKNYFEGMDRHTVKFVYEKDDDKLIEMAFSGEKVDERKEWLTNGMNERKQRRLMGLPEILLYGKDTKIISYSDFINKELILFSILDNERSIPSLVDGLKPGQRKVIFTCIKRNDKREVKVAQLAGSVAEMSAYHHGENSLMTTIINLAQNFVGSNNINLLQPIGQFGTRLQGGKDAASPRYIFTMLSPVTRLIFHPNDDAVLKYLTDDNQKIEPEWYCPIIPMILINGAEGIGTGWSTKVPNYNPREIVENIKRLINNEEPKPMLPWYKNFKGVIELLSEQKYVINGEICVIDNTTIEIVELPLFTWTDIYKETVLEPMLYGSEKVPPLITGFKEYHNDTSIRFVVTMNEEKLAQAETIGLHVFFKLQSTFTTSSMVLFDQNGILKRYKSVKKILKDFCDVRLKCYQRRKDYLYNVLYAEYKKINNQARFILEKIQGAIMIENKTKTEIIQLLSERGYDSDPLKIWKEEHDRKVDDDSSEDEESMVKEKNSGPDYDYLLGMKLWSLVKEFADDLMKKRDAKIDQLKMLSQKSPSDLWLEDLDCFIKELDKIENEEKDIAAPLKETKRALTSRRIIPIIDEKLIKQAEKAVEKKVKTKGSESDDETSHDDTCFMMIDDDDVALTSDTMIEKSNERPAETSDVEDSESETSDVEVGEAETSDVGDSESETSDVEVREENIEKLTQTLKKKKSDTDDEFSPEPPHKKLKENSDSEDDVQSRSKAPVK